MSSMVQAQAAIIALVVSLNLIVIQMCAGSYTPRIVDGMKRNPDMWILLGIYLVAISYGFIILKFVPDSENGKDQFFVSIGLIIGIYTSFILPLYLRNTLKLLRPEEAVSMLIHDVNTDTIRNKDWETDDDIMQPVFDVVYASINRFDARTTRAGLTALSGRLMELFSKLDQDSIKKTTEHFCKNITRTSVIVVQKEDDFVLKDIITLLAKMDTDIIDMKLDKAANFVTNVLRDVGKHAVDQNLEKTISSVTEELRNVGEHAVEMGRDDATWAVAIALRDVGKHAVDNGRDDAAWAVADALEHVAKPAASKYNLEYATSSVADALGALGMHVADKGRDSATRAVVDALHHVGTCVADKSLNNATLSVVDTLRMMGIILAAKLGRKMQCYIICG